MIGHDEAARLASTILDLRRRRTDHLPLDLFGEGAWGLLLVLFVADAASERLSSSEASRRAGGAAIVNERWLKVLEQHGLAACRGPCDDGHLVALTPQGVHAVERCMEDARDAMLAPKRRD